MAIPLVTLRRPVESILFPNAFLSAFRRFLFEQLETLAPTSRLIWVDRYDEHSNETARGVLPHQNNRSGIDEREIGTDSEDDSFFVGAALVNTSSSSHVHLSFYRDLLLDREDQIQSFVAIMFRRVPLLSDDSETTFSVLNMCTRKSERGQRMCSKLLALCLLEVMDNPQFSSIDWSAVSVDLDDCTEVHPPRNLYYRLGFHVWSKATDQFVSWNRWMDQDYDMVLCPNPDERRRIALRDLLWNLSQFLGFRA